MFAAFRERVHAARGSHRAVVASLVMLALAGAVLLSSVASALAEGGRAGWSISSLARPTSFSATDNAGCEATSKGILFCDTYALTVTNVGSAPTSGKITIRDALPAGIAAQGALLHNLEALPDGEETPTPQGKGFVCRPAPTPECEYENPVPPGGILLVLVKVTVPPSVNATVFNHATVEGGGAATVSTSEPSTAVNGVNEAQPGFGVQDFGFNAYGAGGLLDTQAGGHPDSVTASVDLNADIEGDPVQDPKSVVVELPLGLVGNPLAAAQCPVYELITGEGAKESATGRPQTACPSDSRIGTIVIIPGSVNGAQPGEGVGRRLSTINPHAATSAIYNLAPEAGYPAEFGFTYLSKPVVMYASVVPSAGGYSLRVTVPGIIRTTLVHVSGFSATFFGDPNVEDGGGLPAMSFLTNPVDCAAGPLEARVEVDSWVQPSVWRQARTVAYPQMTGCGLLQFQPTFGVEPETGGVDEPSGYAFDLGVPQTSGLAPVATPEVRDVTVTLPEGVSVSPGAADGLAACPETGPEGIGLGHAEGPGPGHEAGEGEQLDGDGFPHAVRGHCPPASQIGTVSVVTPLLSSPLEGHVYLARPGCGGAGQAACTETDAAGGSLFGVFLEAEGSGVVIKLKGRVSANPSTGQLTASFVDNPQFPFSDLRLALDGGSRAPLANPQSCGTAVTRTDISAWSAPVSPDATPFSQFPVNGCAGGVAPFDPGFLAQTSNPMAGAFSPFTVTFSRHDGEQDFGGVQVHTPPGLLGMLSSVSLCGEPQAQDGTCPAASRIGTSTVAAGAGSHPYWVSGPVYLTGSYDGAPFGLSVAVPAVAGPFNLGTVVVRAAINVDRHTGAITVTSAPLPQIVDGVPLRLQTVNVTIDRPGFMFNPTRCVQQQVTATLAGAQGAAAGVSSPFAASGCRGLAFKPSFIASTSGVTSKADGASLNVRVSQRAGEANIRRVDVTVPLVLPARLSTLQKACTEAQFDADPAGCPVGSVVGTARARTPVLAGPLVGPAYLVSHGGAAFPDLVIVLEGEGIRIDLTGNTDIKKGVTYSRFEAVPDAPIGSFELVLPEGPYSALAANGDLCHITKSVSVRKRVTVRRNGRLVHVLGSVRRQVASTIAMPTAIEGQNGARVTQSTRITVTGCPSTRPKTRQKTGKEARKASAKRGTRR